MPDPEPAEPVVTIRTTCSRTFRHCRSTLRAAGWREVGDPFTMMGIAKAAEFFQDFTFPPLAAEHQPGLGPPREAAE